MRHALILVDIQKDFCPGGSLPVPGGDEVVDTANCLIQWATGAGMPVFFTRDWHPPAHSSFRDQGGTWPPHCVAGTDGAAFHDDLLIPDGARIISKAESIADDAYSGFQDTPLDGMLRAEGVEELVIAGLATDYCVKQTVLDARKHGYTVNVVIEGIRAVNVKPGDGETAVEDMLNAGAQVLHLGELLN